MQIKKPPNYCLFNYSTTAITPHSRQTVSLTVGGMTEMEMRNISGPEAIPAFTPASAESTEIASILSSNAIAMQPFRYC